MGKIWRDLLYEFDKNNNSNNNNNNNNNNRQGEKQQQQQQPTRKKTYRNVKFIHTTLIFSRVHATLYVTVSVDRSKITFFGV